MKRKTNERGFQVIEHPVYVPGKNDDPRVVQQSSAIGPYENSHEQPGSSYLWLGMSHHLNREEVRELVAHLNLWLETGRLFSGRGD